MSWIRALLRGSLELVCLPCCPVCRQAIEPGRDDPICGSCRDRLELPAEGLQGAAPLPWWGLGLYRGGLRQLLLQQRRHPQPSTLRALARGLRQTLPTEFQHHGRVVAIPSWKQRGFNPLPQLICQGLGMPEIRPLRRCRPTLGQHHLNRAQRQLNQVGAFRCEANSPERLEAGWRRRPVLIVDDILTTGATAAAAAVALQDAGFRVAGVLCLARTPAPGRDLRSRPAAPAASRDSSVGRAGD